MPSIPRRRFLAALSGAAAGGLAGCGSLSDQSPPAGSLRFENDHNLPHSIRLEVTGVGTESGSDAGGVAGDVAVPAPQRSLTASTTLEPGERLTYESVFTEPVWYGVQFTVDGSVPGDNAGTTRFNPADADGGTWELLAGKVYESGEFSWVVHTTDNAGTFDR
jgi:hypothetical protein